MEYIKGRSADLLNKLRIELIQSRSRHCNDNALAENKNAAVVRKQFGYSHISQRWVALGDDFNHGHLVPYLSFHRPYFFRETRRCQGKERRSTAMRT